ncbi:MAG: carbamoyl phosphate synthase small subunit [Christensenellaceae bacterium]|jgi:carbamoyl-phosphate synthase small subunit|nr:carbamoyl phosphate synthase small subunit [Christensenellaceae bacterium]
MSKAYLVLQNGAVFEGERFGAEGDKRGEAVFTTGMTGYLETLTDPSYFGQIVVQTFPLIGNYGVIRDDFESKKSWVTAYVVRSACESPSNFRCEGDLDGFLKEQGIVALSGVDTRAITRQIRKQGVMNAAILSKLPGDLEALQRELAQMPYPDAVPAVTAKEPYGYEGKNPVILWNFGHKHGIEKQLEDRVEGRLRVVPAGTTAEAILALEPRGIVLSNGPGDPAVNTEIIQNIRKVMEARVPMLGICLGHQLMALAMGGQTEKLKYGHRGANQPVRDPSTGKMYITSQNHGYAVGENSLPQNARALFVNANDGTIEGLEYLDTPAFSVQFHPEACAGPEDTRYLFDRFISLMEEASTCR